MEGYCIRGVIGCSLTYFYVVLIDESLRGVYLADAGLLT